MGETKKLIEEMKKAGSLDELIKKLGGDKPQYVLMIKTEDGVIITGETSRRGCTDSRLLPWGNLWVPEKPRKTPKKKKKKTKQNPKPKNQ